MTRAIIYLRTDDAPRTNLADISLQRTACLRRAAAIGATVVGEYQDDLASADELWRPGLAQMMHRLSTDPVDLVIAYDSTRLMNSITAAAVIMEGLTRCNCELEYAVSAKSVLDILRPDPPDRQLPLTTP